MEIREIIANDGIVLTVQEMEIYFEKLGVMHNITERSNKETYPIPRLLENYSTIKYVYEILNDNVKQGISIHPAGEWILDNFYIIEETVKIIRQELTRKKYKNFIGLKNGKYAGFARLYALAIEIVNHVDNKLEIEDLEKYLIAYQTKKTLNMDEIWNIGLFLQIALIENIRQICEKIYIAQIEKLKVESIIERLIDNKKINKFREYKLSRDIKKISDMKYSFIEYMSYKLKKYGKKTEKHLEILEEIVQKGGSTVSEIIKKEHFDIALKRVSIGNAIISIKKIQRINFLEIFEKINGVEELLNSDPAKVYEKMDYKTKDYYRQAIKEISKKTKISEIYIAKKLLELAMKNQEKKNHIGFYLFGKNRNILYDEIGYKSPKILTKNKKAKYYITMIIVLTLLASLILILNLIGKINIGLGILSIFFLLIPVSEFVIQIIQYGLSKFVKPKLLPKIDMYEGIDKDNATIVVIPTILKTKEKVRELMRKLEVYYLANKSKNLYFCLLGDASESKKEIEDFDQEVIEEGKKQIQRLNEKYSNKEISENENDLESNINIFNFAYRKRKWNPSQQSYLGWERKRGALTELVEVILGNMNEKEIRERYHINTLTKSDIKYLITLDSDTDLTLNSAFELIGTMAHILNKPEIEGNSVVSGHAIIQPRVGVNLDISYKNNFTKIFAGSGGIDSYTNAISDIYQDNFDEGIFAGKGIFDIKVYSEILKNEIPENTVLSHDLLEGCYLRCGFTTDIMIMDGYPSKYLSFMSRLARWIRGDWQIIKWLKSKKMNAISKFKIFDNLRRSLFEISVIISEIYFFVLGRIYNLNLYLPKIFLGLTVVFPFLLEILNVIIFKREGEHKQDTFIPKIGGILGATYRAVLTLGCIPYKAYISLKSIIISIYRMYYTKEKLLDWITSEEAEKASKDDLFSYYKNMYINVIFGITLIIISLNTNTFLNILTLLLGFLWIVTPHIMCNISKEKIDKVKNKKLAKDENQYFLEIAKKTFDFFKNNITKENNYLMPDNYQEDRKQKYVDRTSSTNIGLSLLTVISGADFGFISQNESINLLNKIIENIESLEKWNGHLYNWYNIKTKTPLHPRYISTVDSGNFVGYLYIVKAFLKEILTKDFEDRYEVEDFKENEQYELIKNLKLRVTKLIENTDFSKLYSKSHMLFSIGFNVEDNKLTDSYYDLLASEARQASLVAIAKKDVPSKHWNNLSRTLTLLNNKKGLISWSGTAFEYLMPNINIPRYRGSLLDESCRFAIMSQIEYARKLNIPWGISETAFNVKDLHANYQYKAFGIPWLGLKRGLEDDIVISSYASILAITDKPKEVYKNLKVLEQFGMYGKYGFYESLDLTPSRVNKNGEACAVLTYMAHHQALILLSIDNYINNNIFQKRFIANPELQAVSILLQERMPDTFITTKEEKEIPKKLKYKDYENYAEVTYDKLDEHLIRANILANEDYTVAINQKGQGFSKYKDIYINRFKKTDEYNQGIFCYVKNIKTKKIWSSNSSNTVAIFTPDYSTIELINDNIKTRWEVLVDSEEPVEIRRAILENFGDKEEILEISNVFEPILSTKEQDYAHPAFNNLFLKFDYDYDENILQIKRRKRGKKEKEIFAEIKFFTNAEVIVDNEFEISKEKLDERGNFGIPTAIINSNPFSNTIGLVTDPIVAMKKTIKILPNEKVDLNFLISVNEERNIALKNLAKYNDIESVNRELEILKAKTDAENRYLGVKGKEIILYQKILSYILFDNPLKAVQMQNLEEKNYDKTLLWKHGISGDIPIILTKIIDINDTYIVTKILSMYEFFRSKNIKVDIIFLDEEKYNYQNYVHSEIDTKIADKHLEYMKNISGGIFVISKNEISKEDEEILNFASDIIIDTKKGDLEHFVKDMEEEYLSNVSKVDNKLFENTAILEDVNSNQDILKDKENLKYCNEYGAFSSDGKEYMITLNKENRIPTVWSHILANESFGTVVTENMGGYTWHKNSRLNRITAWHNSAFLDIPSEAIYLQDENTGKTWSLGAKPMPDNNNYNIIYGFGYAKFLHISDEIEQELQIFIPNEDPIKIGILRLNNKSLQRKKLRIVYYLKPVLDEDEIKSNGYIDLKFIPNSNLVQAQNLYENEFNDTVFVSSSEKIKSYTGNKNSFLGKGGLSDPEGLKKYRLDNNNSIGKKACIAIEIEVEIEAMGRKEIILMFGAEESEVNIKNLAYKYSKISNCKQELENVKKKWKNLLEKMQVYTPLESMNIILNGWSLYQTLSSRILGKTGFYQSGGAFGFRDQLQDVLAFKYISPEIVKNQILKHSKHQFIEGDVEHWWHEETKRGIRTRFSDDLLWLPFALEQYIEITGDLEILQIKTPYLQGKTLEQSEEEKYDLYEESQISESIYKHCTRAIDKAINFGEHGLPKIGTGDWNDGFSTVGNKGKGESVWLGFFMYLVLTKFVPIAEKMNDEIKTQYYKKIAEELKKNLNNIGWDGRWFRRAFTDDGEILGSLENEECRIDGISQSWSVISGAGDNDKKFISMESLENYLVDKENGIIKLLDPPFENGKIEPGYIKAYLPGVRENGGQYTHAAIWAILAEAILGFGDKAVELYRMINPIEHSRTKEAAQKYKVEPYVISADIYGASNLTGRGGWTWYTGSSSWFYMTGIEYILGIKIKNNILSFEPCIPKDWKEYTIKYKYGDSIYNIKILNPNGKNTGVTKVQIDGTEVQNSIKLDGSGKIFNVEVEL